MIGDAVLASDDVATRLDTLPSARADGRRAVMVRTGAREQPHELYRVLRRRLLLFSAVMAGTLAALLAIVFWSSPVYGLSTASYMRFSILAIGLPSAVSLSAAALLHWRPPATVTGLRTIELIVTGSVASVILWGMTRPEWYGLVERSSAVLAREDLTALHFAYSESTALRWFALLVGYGVVIPNTWRRCAMVVSVLALSPFVLLAVLGLWLRPLESDALFSVFSGLALWIGLAVVVVVFTAYRVEVLAQEAFEARKLGQYLLKQPLGSGGMGEVYLAEHVLLRRLCAVKLIRREKAGDPSHVQRFEREVRLTATLTHPNTIQIFDYGRTDEDTFYYVMEFLKGLSLDDLVRGHGPLPPGRAVHFLRQVCAALHEAHSIGLLHRDIKPGNVRVCERGGEHDVIKLLDFGLVLPLNGAADGTPTEEATIAGTPPYMSPEQAAGNEQLDARSDIYSVGALAYFLLTGRPPFVYSSTVKTLAAHLHETPPPLGSLRADVPRDLEAVVHRCLAKRREDRYADVSELGEALAACAAAAPWTRADAQDWWRAI
jgi:tRNA A-37 threonylcarbamoyl transferase component Bud32